MTIPKKVAIEIVKIMNDRCKVFDESLTGSDRDTAIVAACLIDNLLERILKSYFIKSNGVKKLFENEHILRTYHAKVNIAYYSGIITKSLYNDLLLIGRIRNKFAHKLDSKISFMDTEISKLVRDFEFQLKSATNKIEDTRINYLTAISVISKLLTYIQVLLIFNKNNGNLKLLQDIIKIDDMSFEKPLSLEQEIHKTRSYLSDLSYLQIQKGGLVVGSKGRKNVKKLKKQISVKKAGKTEEKKK